MCPATEKEEICCPHCGAEPYEEDDLCRFCGKIMVVSNSQGQKGHHGLAAIFRTLKSKIKPISQKKFKYWDTLDLSDPSDPIWDDD